MNLTKSETRDGLIGIAEQAIQRYARDLLSVNALVNQLASLEKPADLTPEATWRWLEKRAIGLCSQALYEACLSSDADSCNRGFDNLERYLREKLSYTVGFVSGQKYQDIEEVVQQTLCEILSVIRQHGKGPDQPVAFLKWARVVLFRQFSKYCQNWRSQCSSLEDEQESQLEAIVDGYAIDPLEAALQGELREALGNAIAVLKNPRYRRVLLSTLLADTEERELAEQWRVQLQDIYLWRYRALKALSKDPRTYQVLQALRQ